MVVYRIPFLLTKVTIAFAQPMRIGDLAEGASPSTTGTGDKASAASKGVGDYAFGVRVVSNWAQGSIVRGNYYKLRVPDSIALNNCTRKMSGAPVHVGEQIEYTFNSDDTNLKELFDSVSCRINVTDPVKLFGNDIVAQKTFSAEVSYEFAVEQTTTVTVGTG